MIITLSMDASRWGNEVVRRCNTVGSDKTHAVRFVSLQEDERFRSLCRKLSGGNEFGRSEWGIIALSRYLFPEINQDQDCVSKVTAPDKNTFQKWFRNGRDPEKLRKLIPDGSFHPDEGNPDAPKGKELFEETLGFLMADFTFFLS